MLMNDEEHKPPWNSIVVLSKCESIIIRTTWRWRWRLMWIHQPSIWIHICQEGVTRMHQAIRADAGWATIACYHTRHGCCRRVILLFSTLLFREWSDSDHNWFTLCHATISRWTWTTSSTTHRCRRKRSLCLGWWCMLLWHHRWLLIHWRWCWKCCSGICSHIGCILIRWTCHQAVEKLLYHWIILISACWCWWLWSNCWSIHKTCTCCRCWSKRLLCIMIKNSCWYWCRQWCTCCWNSRCRRYLTKRASSHCCTCARRDCIIIDRWLFLWFLKHKT